MRENERERERESVCEKDLRSCALERGAPAFQQRSRKKKKKKASRARLSYAFGYFQPPIFRSLACRDGRMSQDDWHDITLHVVSSNWYFFFPYPDVNEFICVGSS